MALSPRLEFRQSQSLVMTPQLMQAIKLLQFSNVELADYVEAELEKNPLLERDEREPFTGPEAGGSEVAENSTSENNSDVAADGSAENWLQNDLETNPAEIASKIDADASDVFPEDSGVAAADGLGVTGRDSAQLASGGLGTGAGPSVGVGEDYNLEAFVAEKPTLSDHLMQQVGPEIIDEQERFVVHALIESLDPSGYLRRPLDEIAEHLGTDEEEVEDALILLQSCDPIGIGARSLEECLILQLKERNRYDPAMETLISNLDLVAKRDFDTLRGLCNVDQEDVIDMITELRALDPKPGHAYEGDAVQAISPDVSVTQRPDGSWAIELAAENLPRVLVNNTYYATVSKTAKDDAEKSFLVEAFQNANWLVKSLDQRAKTILKVATELVRQQDAFFTKGVQYLRPLNLKMIADAIDMHESTVSRVTSNKFIETPRGIFELKYFFTSSISSTEGGEAHSAEAVRHRIKALIDAEDPKKILSDDTIVKILKDDGVDIARRTVAKYREAMRIPSSVQRRREKKLSA